MKLIGTKRIETERLILRKFVIDDVEDMYANWASDPEVSRFLTWPTHTSTDVTKALLENWISNYDRGDFFNWAIEYKQCGKVIGNIAVVELDKSISEVVMGYCLSRSLWGKGIMPEALSAVIKFFFHEADVNRISACHDVNNAKSGRVMDKAGMTLEGTLRQAGKNNQGICDEVWHSIIRTDFF